MRRIAITGAGSINALGMGVDAFRTALQHGRSGIAKLTRFDSTGFRSPWAAEASGLETADAWLTRPLRRRASNSDRMALIAAAEAVHQAKLSGDLRSVGVIFGASTGGMHASEEYLRRSLAADREATASLALATPQSTSGDLTALAFNCYGPRLTVSTACSSGANALGIAADWIRAGRADVMLCGGTDSLCRMTYAGFNSLQAMDREPCRPFDRDRAGLTLGEGAAAFVLEDFETARRRGASILGEFLGYGVSTDAYHITQPRPDGASAAAAFRRALEETGTSPDEIDYVNAHGTATPANDATETRALKEALGPRAYRIPISSTKAITGHCLAAAGAIEALVCLLALQHQFVPPTLHLTNPDPECDLDWVGEGVRSAKLGTVASNSYGFGGNNTTILLRRIDD